MESIHFDYLETGCNVITTNSFVAVPQRMVECGLASDEASSNFRAATLIRASVDRARLAIAKYNETKERSEGLNQKNPLIAGCVPPLTECYFPEKVSTSLDSLAAGYKIILSTLLDCEIDIILAETLSTKREALAILLALSLLKKARPIWISFTIKDDDYTKLRSDELLESTCRSIMKEAASLSLPLKALGVNCSTPSSISNAIPILKQVLDKTNTEIVAYGNCFQKTTAEWLESTKDNNKFPESKTSINFCIDDYDDEGYMLPSAYARYTKEWVDAGATIIGGCCGSRPKHMKAVAKILKQR